jgi:hypothetical protein
MTSAMFEQATKLISSVSMHRDLHCNTFIEQVQGAYVMLKLEALCVELLFTDRMQLACWPEKEILHAWLLGAG